MSTIRHRDGIIFRPQTVDVSDLTNLEVEDPIVLADDTISLAAGGVQLTHLGGDITAAGKALLDDANAAAQRTTMGLGTAAVAATGDFAAASHTHTGMQVINTAVTLTDAATIAVNAALGNIFDVTLGGSRTMGAPTNPVAGQIIEFRLKQDNSGLRVITWNSIYRFSLGLPAPTLTLTGNLYDSLRFRYHVADAKWDCIGITLGFT